MRNLSPWLIAPVLACWLLGAHFLRYGHQAVALACALLPLVLVVRGMGPVRLLQAVLVGGMVTWAVTAAELVRGRVGFGQPYGRLLAILAGVELVTLFAVYALQRWSRGRRAG